MVSHTQLTFLSLSRVCLLYSCRNCVIFSLLIDFVSYQGPPGDRGERGEPGDPGYKVRTILPLDFFIILICDYLFYNLLLCFRGKLVWMVSEVDPVLPDCQ